jgi:hypothetical protein
MVQLVPEQIETSKCTMRVAALAERFCYGDECMKPGIRLIVTLIAALAGFSAKAADITGDSRTAIVAAGGHKEYVFVFRQNGARLIGTARSQNG